MKTREELNTLRNEVEALNRKLAELTDAEMEQVIGGFLPPYPPTGTIRNPGIAASSDPNGWKDPKNILVVDSGDFIQGAPQKELP